MADEGYGSVFDGSCEKMYDFYQGVEEMMPKAFAVSAKSNDFDDISKLLDEFQAKSYSQLKDDKDEENMKKSLKKILKRIDEYV